MSARSVLSDLSWDTEAHHGVFWSSGRSGGCPSTAWYQPIGQVPKVRSDGRRAGPTVTASPLEHRCDSYCVYPLPPKSWRHLLGGGSGPPMSHCMPPRTPWAQSHTCGRCGHLLFQQASFAAHMSAHMRVRGATVMHVSVWSWCIRKCVVRSSLVQYSRVFCPSTAWYQPMGQMPKVRSDGRRVGPISM